MRQGDPAHRTIPAAGLAAGGVLLGHSLAYALLSPDAADRSRLLVSTGHGYLPAAGTIALFSALVAVGALFLGRLTRPSATPEWKSLGQRIALLQVGTFLAMEVVERVGAGAPLAGLLRGGLLPVGIGAQLVITALVVVVVRLVLRASAAAAAVLSRASRLSVASSSTGPWRDADGPTQRLLPITAGRGPPSPP